MTPDDFRDRLKVHRLVGILRNCPEAHLPALAQACRDAGLEFVEVTMNTPDAARQIRILSDLLPGTVVGAGTVLSANQAEAAVQAGARFLVSPCTVAEVQDWARDNGIPTLPGALTPGEIWQAHRSGAAMVKVFPARSLGGPGYFKELRGPFRDIPLLACGGVSALNAREFLDAGADALAFGGSIFSLEKLAAGDIAGITEAIGSLRRAISR